MNLYRVISCRAESFLSKRLNKTWKMSNCMLWLFLMFLSVQTLRKETKEILLCWTDSNMINILLQFCRSGISQWWNATTSKYIYSSTVLWSLKYLYFKIIFWGNTVAQTGREGQQSSNVIGAAVRKYHLTQNYQSQQKVAPGHRTRITSSPRQSGSI